MTKDDRFGGLNSFCKHPIFQFVSIISCIISIISLPLAIYLYQKSRVTPCLTFRFNPVRTAVVRTAESSNISVHYRNQKNQDQVIPTDVTAVQIAVWNRGNRAIRPSNRPSDILRPIVIYIKDGSPILEARIRYQTRDVVNTTLDVLQLDKGRLGVSWNILEEDDGCSLQLIYEGNDTTVFCIDGVIVGQKSLSIIRNPAKFEKQAEQDEGKRRINWIIGWINMSIGIVIVLLTLRILMPSQILSRQWHYSMLAYGVFVIILSIVFLLMSREIGPPFGY